MKSATTWSALQKLMDQMNPELPESLIVSGKDLTLFDMAVAHARKRLERKGEPYEVTLLSGEVGDDAIFYREVFHVPLFSPYRLIIVRKGETLFAPIVSTPNLLQKMGVDFKKVPDRTWILIEFSGNAPQKFLDQFGDGLIHIATKELYENQAHETILATLKRLNLRLEEDALYELMQRIEPGTGVIERSLTRLKDLLPPERNGVGTIEDVREILYPAPGMNPFKLVDAIFERQHSGVRKELNRFNPQVDSLFPVLKIMLNRTNEIRKAAVGIAHGMGDAELVNLLDMKGKHPFIQKKNLRALRGDIQRYRQEELNGIYRMLIDLQNDFRTRTGAEKQLIIFEERLLRHFFAISR